MKKQKDHETLLKFKRVCKAIKRESDLSLMQVQDRVAERIGFDSYHDLRKSWSFDNRLIEFISTQEYVEFNH